MNKAAFSAAILLSSFLLFMVQPMVGRMLLPSLGGTPSVWNTCVVFFQAVLLLGYGYAHFAARRISLKRHVLVHWFLLGVVICLLPIQLINDWAVPTESSPLGWLLGQLVLCVGFPFFVISSSAPLLQRWYSKVSGTEGQDPYFLYAISNVGSLGALFAYPLLVEPNWGITAQTSLWFIGFLGLVSAFVACGVLVLRSQRHAYDLNDQARESVTENYTPLSWRQRLHYIVLAAIPSSLMLGVTTFITTDVGSFPLMWVLPLAVYLLTFIFVFARRQVISHSVVVRLVPYALLFMPIVILMDMGASPLMMIAVHVGVFFLVAMMCHGEMARLRPPANQLTEFYLMMSIGGVIGGAFNAMLAPVIFSDVLEYPLMLVAAAAFLPVRGLVADKNITRFDAKDIAWAVGLAVMTGVGYAAWNATEIESRLGLTMVMFAIPAMACFATIGRPGRFTLCFGVLMAGCSMSLVEGQTMDKARGFFGVNEVAYDPDSDFRWLVNGRTIHGLQRASQSENPEPLSYFHRLGPMGDIFSLKQLPADAKVAVVGLGVGSIASYAKAGQHFDFYEIDPVVVRMAQDPKHFNYLSSCKAEQRVILGDARIQLGLVDSPDPAKRDEKFQYDLLILDAFSSDSIPMHLMTKEAMSLYLDRLAPGGMMVMNITNKFVNIRPMILGFEQEFGLKTAVRLDLVRGSLFENDGRLSVCFCVLSREQETIDTFLATERWKNVTAERGPQVWTDDHSNIFDILEWLPSI